MSIPPPPSHNGKQEQNHTPIAKKPQSASKMNLSLTPGSPSFFLNDPTYLDDSNITVSATVPCEASVAYVKEKEIARIQG